MYYFCEDCYKLIKKKVINNRYIIVNRMSQKFIWKKYLEESERSAIQTNDFYDKLHLYQASLYG